MPTVVSSNALIVPQSIANMFLIQCLLSLLFTIITHEVILIKLYLAIAASSDLGYIYASYRGMGSKLF
ncbi:hypothetical protein GQ44DRAFT_697146 [Phaeosphaeriaceae sp. PMI808]|nr:hypothetical protein GQ44DRAFT_697146 [Phaeosphaeriaceae sp. PMI808]